MMQELAQRWQRRTPPVQFPLLGAAAQTDGQRDAVTHQIVHQPVDRADLVEFVKHDPHDAACLLVGIEGDFAIG